MIVAIDGPAGSGKSTIAKENARQLGFNKLDTGAMYRAVTFAALDRGIDLDDEAAIDALAEQIEIRFTNGTGEDTRLTIDGQDASAAIRTPQVDANVSKVSAYPGVRAAMLIHQRRAVEDRDIVAEGRDMPVEDVRALATGLTFTGMTAVENGLADEIGTKDDAVAKAAELANIAHYTTVTLKNPTSSLSSLLDLMSKSNVSTDDIARALKELDTDGSIAQ